MSFPKGAEWAKAVWAEVVGTEVVGAEVSNPPWRFEQLWEHFFFDNFLIFAINSESDYFKID